MKVPDAKINFSLTLLRSIISAPIEELSKTCAEILLNITNPVAIIVSLNIPGLNEDRFERGSKADLSLIENSLNDFGIADFKKKKHPNFLHLNTDDGTSISVANIKYLGNPVGFIAAASNDSDQESIVTSEAVWLCALQLNMKIHSILSPGSPAADEILARQLMNESIKSGIDGVAIVNLSGESKWPSIHRNDDRIIFREIENSGQSRLGELDDGEMMTDEHMKLLWPDIDMKSGVWIAITPGKFAAVGFDIKGPATSQIISKARSIIENNLIKNTEYLSQAFDKLKAEFRQLIKSERAAAITETAVTVNHEINNPLTAILGNTQLLLMSKDKLPPDVVAKLETIERSAAKIRETTTKLMAIIEPVTTPYASGLEMIDIEKSKKKKPKSS